jgi:ubiquitin carboxyl-terminal hydrolase 10
MILIFQLKRFVYNKDSAGIEKVGKHISYPEKLVIPRTCYPGENRPTYRLTAVVFHHGYSAEGGHYTVDVRKSFKQDELWQRINDANIVSVPLHQVLADRKREASAYLLFYQRMKDSKHDL